MHKLLDRQLRRHFGAPESVPPELKAFVDAVEQSYIQNDDDRAMLEHSMETVSEELVERFGRLNDAVIEREHAVAQSKALADRFKSAFGDAPIGMTIVSTDGCWREVNRAMCELLGRNQAELVGRTSEHMTHPDDRAMAASVVQRLCSGLERTARLEERFVRPDGRVVWTLVYGSMLGGDAEFILLQVLDITEQRAAEASLRRQALVFETMTEGVIVCEPDGPIVDVNPAAQVIFGYTSAEMIGQSPSLWQRSDVSPPILQTIRHTLHATGNWSGEYGFVAKDGRTGVVESTITTLRDTNGKPLNTIGVTRDITERRELDRQLLQAQKLEAIGSLAAGVAHEINTPTQYVGDNVRFIGDAVDALAGLVGDARALADAARPHASLADAVATFESAVEAADTDYLLSELALAASQSREGCERISDIVGAMKEFSHPGGKQKQAIDLNAAVRNTITVCRNEWKYVATLATDFDASIPPVHCLPGELQQVVLNLIVNAAHAVEQARRVSGGLGHIAVATRRDGDWVEIRVEDDGCGIPESIHGKVFDPFFTTKEVGSGTGQGLSISYTTIVRKHQGTLTFESTEGKGTTFVVRVPLDGVATV